LASNGFRETGSGAQPNFKTDGVRAGSVQKRAESSTRDSEFKKRP